MSHFPQKKLLPVVQDHLYSQDLEHRERAADFLGRTTSRVVVKQLISALKHRDRYVAIRAAWGLTLMKPALVVPCLAPALDARDCATLKQAAWALGRMKSLKARQVLVAALEHRRRSVRQEAAGALWLHALRGFRSKRVECLLAGMLKGDRGHAVLTLRHMREARRTPERARLDGSFFKRQGGDWIR